MTDFADWLRAERAHHMAAIARIDERLAALGGPLPPKIPAACLAILEAAAPETVTVASIWNRMLSQGRIVTDAAVYQALTRLAKTHPRVERVAPGKYRWKTTTP